MDRLDELTALVAILEAGSLAAAGRKLRRSPPAMTRLLASLEERVGARLIERTSRRLTATEAGRRLGAPRTSRRTTSSSPPDDPGRWNGGSAAPDVTCLCAPLRGWS